jgi:hypothetical protein
VTLGGRVDTRVRSTHHERRRSTNDGGRKCRRVAAPNASVILRLRRIITIPAACLHQPLTAEPYHRVGDEGCVVVELDHGVRAVAGLAVHFGAVSAEATGLGDDPECSERNLVGRPGMPALAARRSTIRWSPSPVMAMPLRVPLYAPRTARFGLVRAPRRARPRRVTTGRVRGRCGRQQSCPAPVAYQRILHRTAQFFSDDDVPEDEPITALKQGPSRRGVKRYRSTRLIRFDKGYSK